MKKFYEKKPSKNFKQEVRELLKSFGVRVHFVKKGWCSAIGDDLIEIDVREARTVQELWSLVFHELGHIYCYRMGKYKIYHHNTLPPKKFAKYIRQYGLRAERYVDKLGAQFMKDFFPEIPFIAGYSTEDMAKWYYKWVRRNFPL